MNFLLPIAILALCLAVLAIEFGVFRNSKRIDELESRLKELEADGDYYGPEQYFAQGPPSIDMADQ